MYFDPISAWLVTLLVDGAEIICEKTKAGSVDDYYKECLQRTNDNLNGSIRMVKRKYSLDLPDMALKQVQQWVNVANKSYEIQHGYGHIVIYPDNQEYIIELLEACVKKYSEYKTKFPNSADEYQEKIKKYNQVIGEVRKQKEKQLIEIEENKIREEKSKENEKLVTVILVLIVVFIFLVATFS